MSPRFPEVATIAKALNNRVTTWVVFLGAGASGPFSVNGGPTVPGLPGAGHLAEEIAKNGSFVLKPGDDLARIAERFLYSAAGGRGALEAVVKRHLMTSCPPRPVHHLIAQCRQMRFVVTTNYDTLLESALGSAGRQYTKLVHEQFNPRTAHRDLSVMAPNDELLLHKMHGSIETPDSLVISESDYIRYLVRLRDPDRGMPQVLRTSVLGQGQLLFLGYSLRDWTFRMLWDGLLDDRASTAPQSFAIVRHVDPADVQFWAQRRVQLIESDLTDFAIQLAAELGITLP